MLDGYKYNPSILFNYDKISKNSKYLSLTRLLALRLKAQSYLTLSQFFESLSNSDVDELSTLVEKFETYRTNFASGNREFLSEATPVFTEVYLLVEMLCRAEGLVPSSLEDVEMFASRFVTIVVMASLERKGLIRVTWKNASMDDTYDDKPLASKI